MVIYRVLAKAITGVCAEMAVTVIAGNNWAASQLPNLVTGYD